MTNKTLLIYWLSIILVSALTGFNMAFAAIMNPSIVGVVLVSINVWTLMILNKGLSKVKRYAKEVF